VAEAVGTFFFVLLYMIGTDKQLRHSNDRSIIALTIAASYVGARLMSGGNMISGIP
jgi:glycerol uptake facilitator-like aquaporin